MFEGLIGFAEETVFARINQILGDEKNTQVRVAQVIYLLLGVCRPQSGYLVLLGDALVGERERLHDRVQQFFERIDLQLRQILRGGADASGCHPAHRRRKAAAAPLTAFVEGGCSSFCVRGFPSPAVCLGGGLAGAQPRLTRPPVRPGLTFETAPVCGGSGRA